MAGNTSTGGGRIKILEELSNSLRQRLSFQLLVEVQRSANYKNSTKTLLIQLEVCLAVTSPRITNSFVYSRSCWLQLGDPSV